VQWTESIIRLNNVQNIFCIYFTITLQWLGPIDKRRLLDTGCYMME